jgi:hypothetical protein
MLSTLALLVCLSRTYLEISFFFCRSRFSTFQNFVFIRKLRTCHHFSEGCRLLSSFHSLPCELDEILMLQWGYKAFNFRGSMAKMNIQCNLTHIVWSLPEYDYLYDIFCLWECIITCLYICMQKRDEAYFMSLLRIAETTCGLYYSYDRDLTLK